MDNKVYIFCLEYHYNHYVNFDKRIDHYIHQYRDILGVVGDAKYMKNLYKKNIDLAQETLARNITFCEKRYKVDKKNYELKYFQG